jgi:nitric oxide reductase subunit C
MFHMGYRRSIFFMLVSLSAVQSALTWTTSTEVRDSRAVFNPAAQRGAQWYREFNCTACHQFYGLGGYMGPDLTNVIIAPGKGPAFAKGILLHGTQRMPPMGLSPEQADDLVAYLSAAAATGEYPFRSMELTPWGTYQQMHGRDE